MAPILNHFAASYLKSLNHLHVLELCVSQRERWHDAAAIAQALDMSQRDARAALDHLTCSNLLDIRITGDIRYRFRPGTSDLEARAVEFVEAFKRNPLPWLEIVGGNGG
jgi:hypothetical protein